MIGADIVGLIAWFCAGAVLGAVFLLSLRRSTLAISGGGGWKTAAVWTVLRLALAAAAFWLAAQYGAGPLLTMLLGFLVTRTALLGRMKETHGGG